MEQRYKINGPDGDQRILQIGDGKRIEIPFTGSLSRVDHVLEIPNSRKLIVGATFGNAGYILGYNTSMEPRLEEVARTIITRDIAQLIPLTGGPVNEGYLGIDLLVGGIGAGALRESSLQILRDGRVTDLLEGRKAVMNLSAEGNSIVAEISDVENTSEPKNYQMVIDELLVRAGYDPVKTAEAMRMNRRFSRFPRGEILSLKDGW